MPKQCTKCKEWKDTEEYTNDRQKRDGLRSSCRPCNSRAKVKERLSIEYKRCNRCKKAKLKEECFTKDCTKSDGYCSICRECRGYKKHKPANFIEKGSGYIRVGCDKRQHRVIMENVLGRKLDTNEHVHHINGDKSDNRLNNLCVMSKSEHHKLHHRGELTLK